MCHDPFLNNTWRERRQRRVVSIHGKGPEQEGGMTSSGCFTLLATLLQTREPYRALRRDISW